MSTPRILMSMGMLILGLGLGAAAARDFRQVWVIDPERFAAIAYSPSTGKYGYSYNYRSRSAAETAALEHLPQPDARIVCWVKAGFCALAKGDDISECGVGWSYGKGARTEDAREAAVEDCGKKTTHPYLALLVLSDGQLVWDHAPDNPGARENREFGDNGNVEGKQTSQSPVEFPATPIPQANASPAPKQLGKLSPSMMEQLSSAGDEKRKSQSAVETGNASIVQPNKEQGQTEKKSLSEIFQFGKSSKPAGAATDPSPRHAKESAATGAWQTSWDAFLTLVEQQLNQLPPNAVGPWEGKEVTWEGTVQDMEVMTTKNVVRLVVAMPQRTLSIKGNPATADRVMIFVPMTYENMGPAKIGAKIRFKTTIAPIDAAHRAVSTQATKETGKGFLLIFTKGGTISK
jgi:uncharacterized protein DUF4189